MTLTEVLERFNAIRNGDGYKAICPAHADKNPSLRISEGEGGRVLLKCFAGCTAAAVCEAAGIKLADLMPPREKPKPAVRVKTWRSPEAFGEWLAKATHAELEAVYRYSVPDALPTYAVVRIRNADGSKTFRPMHCAGGGWTKGDPPGKLPLFRLHEIRDADIVFICEGEKAAMAGAELNLPTTTTAHGAQSPQKTDFSPLAGKLAVVLPDNDPAGAAYGRTFARLALQAGARAAKIVELPGLPPKGDIVEFIAARDSVESEAIAAQIRELADAAPDLTAADLAEPEAPDRVPATAAAAEDPDARLRQIAEQMTDTGAAARFVVQHRDRFRYSFPDDRWLIWDGRRWAADTKGAVWQAARTTALALFDEARDADESRREDLFKFAITCQKRERLAAMIALARSDLAVDPNRLDAGAFLLNVANGTVDLRTGELRGHDPADLITRLAPAEYHPNAEHQAWTKFLDDATGGDAEFEAFLRRAFGYSLTGDVSEEVLFFIHGPSAAGKSTFIEGTKATLGDYSITADFESFLERKGPSGGARNDIARLAGARYVTSVEVSDGRTLAQGLVKLLSGGDTVTARMLYRESFEFVPTFKLWLGANHAPRVDDRDDALWRRIIRIPFEHVVPEGKRDPGIKLALKEDPAARAAILAWGVRGCLEWRQKRLSMPAMIRAAIASYRHSQDPLKDFFEEWVMFAPGLEVGSTLVWRAYQQHAADAGIRKTLTRAQLRQRLIDHGCTPVHREWGWAMVGLDLRRIPQERAENAVPDGG